MIDNNQKLIFLFLITSFQNYIRVKLKLYSFINRANVLTLSYCYGEIDENSSAPSHFLVFTGARQSGDRAWLVISYEYFITHILPCCKPKNERIVLYCQKSWIAHRTTHNLHFYNFKNSNAFITSLKGNPDCWNKYPLKCW